MLNVKIKVTKTAFNVYKWREIFVQICGKLSQKSMKQVEDLMKWSINSLHSNYFKQTEQANRLKSLHKAWQNVSTKSNNVVIFHLIYDKGKHSATLNSMFFKNRHLWPRLPDIETGMMSAKTPKNANISQKQ